MTDLDSRASYEEDLGGRKKLIDISTAAENPVTRTLLRIAEPALSRAFAIKSLNDRYAQAALHRGDEDPFSSWARVLDIKLQVSDEDVERIPRDGPLVVVSNHPFGGMEGILLAKLLTSVRDDWKGLGNHLLKQVDEIADRIIPVDVFGGKSAQWGNAKALQQCVSWVKEGGALITFPAGEVASLKLRQGKIADPAWSPGVGFLVRMARANVLPVFFPGRNSLLFQLAGLVHPLLRTALLPRELVNKRGRELPVFIGKSLPWRKLASFGSNEELVDFLRVNTFVMRNRTVQRRERRSIPLIRRRRGKAPVYTTPVATPGDPKALAAEVAALPPERCLDAQGDFGVYVCSVAEAPTLVREIGIQREVTFRQVQEGTGKPLDLDRFDDYYRHLFLWNHPARELVGAYRVGMTREILEEHGPEGLYTSTLFRYRPDVMDRFYNGLELGRSFIRTEYQRQQNCLAMLWKGIGGILHANPDYHILYGPVSISRDYMALSKNLIIEFLSTMVDHDTADLIQPRNPYKAGRKSRLRDQPDMASMDVEDISLLISEIEEDGKGVPTLIRHYLRFNASILSFNVDPEFSDVVDSLMRVDLRKTDRRILKRFMGREGFAAFKDRHGLADDDTGKNVARRRARVSAVS